MKTKIWKVLSVGLTLGLLLSLAVAPAVSVSAATQAWSKVTMPQTVSDTDVGPIVVGPDGALYAAVIKEGTSPTTTIMKSTDGGYSWTATRFEGIEETVVDIAVAPDGTLYVGCTDAFLYRVTASSVELIKPIVDSTGDPAGTIHSVDVWSDGTSNWVMVATDVDVLVLKDYLFEDWRDQELNKEAFWAGFAPDFTTTEFIWAVYADGTDTVITATKSPGQWGNLIQDIKITGFQVTDKSDVVFPEGYSSNAPILFAALNGTSTTATTTTAIYRCETGGVGTVPVINLASLGTTGATSIRNLVYTPAAIYAGVGNSAMIIRSLDGGDNFVEVTKSPTGVSDTYVALLPSGAVIAATSGAESAVSYSADGATFNQISYIDTAIDAIVDVAFRPTDNSALMLTTNSANTNTSLWRTLDYTASTIFWERVALDLSTTATQLVEYSLDGVAAFWYDGAAGGQIKRSTNNAQSFTTWKNLPATATLNDWVMPNNATIYAALSSGFWGTTQYGSMALIDVAGSADLVSIDLSGNALVVGTDNGNVFYSPNKGYAGTWKDVTGTSGLSDDTYVSFAEGSDVMVYAAAGDTLMRLADATATTLKWAEVVSASTTYTLGAADAIVAAPGAGNTYEGSGMAYVTDADKVLRVRGVGPVVATESPAYETIGAPTGATALSGIWYTPGSNVLWTIAGGNELWTYTDILNVSGSGVAVSNVETVTAYSGFLPGGPTATSYATISFNALAGASSYKVVVNTTPQTNLYTASTSTDVTWTQTSAPGAATITGKVEGLDAGTTYYVSVWADTPVSSFLFGGAPVSFNTPPASPGVVEPFLSPEPGARNVPINPTFQWMPVTGADHYEFQLSTAYDFAGAQTVSVSNVYYAVSDLQYDTAYYWRVRAVMADDTASAWVSSVFSTMAEPLPPVTVTVPPVTNTVTQTVTQPPQVITLPASTVTLPASTVTLPGQTITAPAVTVTAPPQTITMPAAETPTYVWAVIGIGALLVIAVIVLIVRTRRAV